MVQQRQAAFAVGDALPEVRKTVTQEMIDRYAEASGDRNPLHIDPEFAATTQFGGVIAHGMLTLAFVSEMLTAAFGDAWVSGGRLKVRFRGAARPGDEVIARGRVTSLDDGRVSVALECVNGAGEGLISGTAEVTLQ